MHGTDNFDMNLIQIDGVVTFIEGKWHNLQDLDTEAIEEAIHDAARIVNTAAQWVKQQGMSTNRTVSSAIKPISDVTSDAKASIMHYANNQKVTTK